MRHSSQTQSAEDRFSRTRLLVGEKRFERLQQARVAIVGLGAVGSYAAEGLARAGIGHLRLVDFDVVRPSNINRQLFALDSTVGKPKTDVAAARVHDINPMCDVETLSLFADPDSMPAILAGLPDVLIDAIDSVGPKVGLLAAAHSAGLRIIAAMGAATRTDPSLIRVGDIAETKTCPLARFMRQKLKKHGIVQGIRCIYSIEPVPPGARAAPEGREHASTEPAAGRRGRTRATLGSLSCITGIFGLIAAREALDMLIGLGSLKQGI